MYDSFHWVKFGLMRERLSTGESRQQVRHDGAAGDTVPPLQADETGSERADSTSDIADEEEHSAITVEYVVSGDREPSIPSRS